MDTHGTLMLLPLKNYSVKPHLCVQYFVLDIFIWWKKPSYSKWLLSVLILLWRFWAAGSSFKFLLSACCARCHPAVSFRTTSAIFLRFPQSEAPSLWFCVHNSPLLTDEPIQHHRSTSAVLYWQWSPHKWLN